MTRLRRPIVGAAVVLIAIVSFVFRSRLPLIGHRFGAAGHGEAPASGAASPGAAVPTPTTSNPSPSGINRGDVAIDARRQQLIGVRTAAVKRTTVGASIRTTGAVRYDETRQTDVNVKVDGWIRELYVDYTGQAVTSGQPLFTLYSPALLSTQGEFLLALKTRDQVQQSQVADAREQADRLVASARQRLKLWDLPPDAITALEEKRETVDAVTFRAPVSGVVIEKTAVKGLHVVPGQSLYKIADLSVVWIEADVYENETTLVRLGQTATVTLDAYPASRFNGRVIYTYPYVDEKTRTNRVRIAFENPGGRLKPGMFANVELQTSAGTGLTVPIDAVLDSGTDQVVFVAQGDGHFEPRRVKAGRRFGGEMQILAGLKEGEQVATGAAFFLDSESQLRGALAAYEPTPGSAGVSPHTLAITLQTNPSPAKAGENQFVVTVKDRDGKPLTDADVAVQIFMPAMPTMNMPAIRNDVKLAAAGAGEYRGTGQIMIAGRWDATVIVSKAGQRLGTTQTTLVAR